MSHSVMQFGECTLDTSERQLTRAGRTIALEPKAYDLLVVLARHAGRLVTKRELLDLVWPGAFVEEGILAVHVSNLRKALGDRNGRRQYIQTVPRSGYRFIGGVSEERKPVHSRSRESNREPSIVVLPFENMSGDAAHEYFSDGLADEITHRLTRMSGLKVIARTSAFAFKGQHQDVRRIAETLDVETVLEGSVRRDGGRIRITAQLITAVDGSHLWSQQYEREIADVFAIQDDIARAIADALHVELSRTPRTARHVPTLAAYESLLKGRHHMLRVSVESLARAQACFGHAMMSDPDYAEPHASLGLSYFLDSMIFRGSLEHTVSTIRTEATEALRLDPSEPGPHLLLGAIAAAYEYDWQKAGEHFSLATSGTSVPVDAHWACATLYLQPLGRFREAVVHMEQAVARDPLNAFWRGVLASHLAHAEQYDRAIEQARTAAEIDATSFVPHFTLGEAYATMGRWPQAIHALERAHELSPHDAMTTGLLAGALVRNGESARGAVLVRELGETPRPLIGRALYHVLSLETPLAADWYERAIRGRDPFALVFANTPLLTTFRQTDQWPKLASLMKLPDA